MVKMLDGSLKDEIKAIAESPDDSSSLSCHFIYNSNLLEANVSISNFNSI